MTAAAEGAKARAVDMKLEVVVIPVSDVDRAKRFCGGPGWRLDAGFAAGASTRPGSRATGTVFTSQAGLAAAHGEYAKRTGGKKRSCFA